MELVMAEFETGEAVQAASLHSVTVQSKPGGKGCHLQRTCSQQLSCPSPYTFCPQLCELWIRQCASNDITTGKCTQEPGVSGVGGHCKCVSYLYFTAKHSQAPRQGKRSCGTCFAVSTGIDTHLQ